MNDVSRVTIGHAPTCPVAKPGFVPDVTFGAKSQCNCDFNVRMALAMGEELPKNFAAYPPTVGELRSDKSASAKDWTPRDALISLLRDIDNGMKVDALIVSFRYSDQEGVKCRFRAAVPDMVVAFGLLERTKFGVFEL